MSYEGRMDSNESVAALKKPINIFYHVCMINDWENVVQQQIDCMLESGILEVASLSIGCLGSSDDRDKLNWMVSTLPRVHVIGHSPRLQEYEFFTLRLMHKACQHPGATDFYGIYLHTKSVSYPGHTGGKYWRDYMQHYCVTRWRDCVSRLDDGNELCGVKLLTARKGPAFKLHYSGNFYWFRSEYIALLPTVEMQDMTNRYNAEIWHGLASPVAATMCQEFVDYNTKGIFKTNN